MDAFFCFFRWASPPTWHHLFLLLKFKDDDNRDTKELATNVVGDIFLTRLASHIEHLHESSFGNLDKITIQSFLAMMRQMYTDVYVPGVNANGAKVNFGVVLSKFRMFEPRLQLMPLASALFDQVFKSVNRLSTFTAFNSSADTASFIAVLFNGGTMNDYAVLNT